VKGKPTTKPASTGKLHYDQDRHAYLLDSESLEAVYIASAAPSPSESPTPTKEFTSLAYNEISLAFIRELPDSDCDEYNAFFTALGSLNTSVDWHSHTQPVDFFGLTYKAPNQHAHTLVDPSVLPFFLDSGASVHISNTKSDFYSLCPISPGSVSGIGGSSVQAVAVGTIHLIVAKGIHLTLDNILFIPSATVCLLSVSALCSAHCCVASFNESSCWVQTHSGTWMLTGILTSHHLYALSGGQLSADHAYLAHHQPTLESWHHCLGHANYQTIYDLACLGNATSMPIDLSSLPPICDNCILGKQTRKHVPKVREGERATHKLGIMHVDLMEHPDTVSVAGNRYVMDILMISHPTLGQYL
jgi:hypothetical protein